MMKTIGKEINKKNTNIKNFENNISYLKDKISEIKSANREEYI